MKPPTLSSLPSELIYPILTPFLDPPFKSVLLSVNLLSRHFHSLSLPLLYHTLLVRTTTPSIATDDFTIHFRHLERHPSFTHCVKKVIIRDPLSSRTFAWGSERTCARFWADANRLLTLVSTSIKALELVPPDPPHAKIWQDIFKSELCVPSLPYLERFAITPPYDVFQVSGTYALIPHIDVSKKWLAHLDLEHVNFALPLGEKAKGWRLRSLILRKVTWEGDGDPNCLFNWFEESSQSMRSLKTDLDSFQGRLTDLLKAVETFRNISKLIMELYEEVHEISHTRLLRIVPPLERLTFLSISSDGSPHAAVPLLELLPNISQSPLSSLTLERIIVRSRIFPPIEETEWRLLDLKLVGLRGKFSDVDAMKKLMGRTRKETLLARGRLSMKPGIFATRELEEEFCDWLLGAGTQDDTQLELLDGTS
ncbi:hypothetical protein BT69DRAFT_942219 [Atractiella rhizophila]|nr:hypothetical protein BT69DRAFT_942219 [Atractiella rhizophila]